MFFFSSTSVYPSYNTPDGNCSVHSSVSRCLWSPEDSGKGYVAKQFFTREKSENIRNGGNQNTAPGFCFCNLRCVIFFVCNSATVQTRLNNVALLPHTHTTSVRRGVRGEYPKRLQFICLRHISTSSA